MQFSFKVLDQPLAHRGNSTSGEATPGEQTTGGTRRLLDLPLEIRQQVWIHVLRPDCAASAHRLVCEKNHQHPKTFLGCTRILLVCSQIYHETIEMLHTEEKTLNLGIYSKFLRDPRENGKPGYFTGLKVSTRCYVPRQFEELQVLRFRKLHLHLVFPEPIALRFRTSHDYYMEDRRELVYETHLRRALDNLQRMAQVLGKSKDLKQLRLTFERKRHAWSFENSTGGNTPLMPHTPVLEHLQALVTAVAKLDCVLVAESMADADIEGEPEDPLAADIISFAQQAGVKAQLEITPRPLSIPDSINVWLQDTWTSASDGSTTEDGWGVEEVEPEAEHASFLPTQPLPSPVLPTVLPADLKLPRTSTHPYQLIPECRTCYALFPSSPALRHHLTATHPHHRRSFRPKVWNKLDRFALAGPGMRKCWTCARGFVTVAAWERHAKEKGHERKGVVPRWMEDNKAWERRWMEREKKLGWL